MSIKKVKTKSGEIKWDVCIYLDGRGSKRTRRRFDRKADAEEYIHDLKTKKKQEQESPFKKCSFEGRTFEDEASYWLSNAELRFSASHLVRVRGILKELLPRFGKKSMDYFTPEILSRFQQQEMAKGSKAATVNRKTEVVTSVINHSVKHRRIPFSPAHGFQKLSKSSEEMSFWERKEAESFLAFSDLKYPRGSENRWVYVVYLLALNTGLRAGEIWGLKPIDIAEDGKSLFIRRQFSRVTLDFAQTKSKKSRFVPCNPHLLEELKELLTRGRIRPDEAIFLNEKRRPVCHDNFLVRKFDRDLREWGGRSLRFHDLRHTAATQMIANGIDIKTVKEICGHASIQTTIGYSHLVAGAVERVSQTFSVGNDKSLSVRDFKLVR